MRDGILSLFYLPFDAPVERFPLETENPLLGFWTKASGLAMSVEAIAM